VLNFSRVYELFVKSTNFVDFDVDKLAACRRRSSNRSANFCGETPGAAAFLGRHFVTPRSVMNRRICSASSTTSLLGSAIS
jgi:hypothetical protein